MVTNGVTGTTINHPLTLPHNDMLALIEHIANKGPVATSVVPSDWWLYFGGQSDREIFSFNFSLYLYFDDILKVDVSHMLFN